MISFYAIVLNEEEQVRYMLDCAAQVADLLDVCSIVDNGSTDATLDIVHSYRDRVPLQMLREVHHSHHGQLRNLALSICRGDYVLYLDADETWTRDMRDWLLSEHYREADQWDFYKYTTIVDRFHYVSGGNGPCYRMFRRAPGIHYTQNVHTEAVADSLGARRLAQGPLLFDHTACKSREALISKGWRYQVHQGTVGVGPWHEYIGRVENAHRLGLVSEFDGSIRNRIFTGP